MNISNYKMTWLVQQHFQYKLIYLIVRHSIWVYVITRWYMCVCFFTASVFALELHSSVSLSSSHTNRRESWYHVCLSLTPVTSFTPVTRVWPGLSDPPFVNSNQASQPGLISGHDSSDTTWVTTQEQCIPISWGAGNGQGLHLWRIIEWGDDSGIITVSKPVKCLRMMHVFRIQYRTHSIL